MPDPHIMTEVLDAVAPITTAFSGAFQQVLSQASGNSWSVSVTSKQLEAATAIFTASACGVIEGEFCFRFTPETGSALGQVLLMSESPKGSFDDEEREAAIELLRQICGHCATALSAPGREISFTVLGEGPQPSSTQQEFTIHLSSGERSIDIGMSLSRAFCANLSHQQQPSVAPATCEDPRTKNLDLLLDIQLGVRLRFGSRRMKLREILEFHAGTIVELDRQVQEPVDLLADTKLIARGEVVVVEGNYGLKITEVLSPRQCLAAIT